LIYGESPINIIEKCFIHPHIKEPKNDNHLFCSIIAANPSVLTPGTGITDKSS
jgi:hypothetical protein